MITINELTSASNTASSEAQVAKQISKAIVKGARESCEDYGNPLRKGLREYFEDQLVRTENPDPKLLKLFGITLAEAKKLSQKQIKELNYDINVRFAAVPCGTQYSLKKEE